MLRCDFNVPVDEKGVILNDFRIKQSLPTIEYLLSQGAKVILMSHLRRPEGKVVESLRLDRVQEELSKHLNLSVAKTKDCVGQEVKEQTLNMEAKEILLLENLRFHKEEEQGDDGFAKELADLGEIYINDAFSICHREHASITGVPKYLPSAAGFLLEKEIKVLARVLKNPWRPLVIIVGGVKVDTKLGVVEQFLQKADHLLLGGQVANAVLQAKGIIIGKYLEPKFLKRAESVDITHPKIHLPVDGLIALENRQESYFRVGGVGSVRKEESVFDIGPETVKIFSQIIKSAKMILWAGPLGLFEEEKFAGGTRQIAQNIARNHSAFKVAGGGDTNAALDKFNLREKFDHISTGGGAMLEFVSGKNLPGIEALG